MCLHHPSRTTRVQNCFNQFGISIAVDDGVEISNEEDDFGLIAEPGETGNWDDYVCHSLEEISKQCLCVKFT